MNLHEYQAKEILSGFGVRIQRGYVASTPENAVAVANKLNEETGSDFFVVKAQVHAGGRGKGGGVKLAKSIDEVYSICLLYTSPSPRDKRQSRMPSSA